MSEVMSIPRENVLVDRLSPDDYLPPAETILLQSGIRLPKTAVEWIKLLGLDDRLATAVVETDPTAWVEEMVRQVRALPERVVGNLESEVMAFLRRLDDARSYLLEADGATKYKELFLKEIHGRSIDEIVAACADSSKPALDKHKVWIADRFTAHTKEGVLIVDVEHLVPPTSSAAVATEYWRVVPKVWLRRLQKDSSLTINDAELTGLWVTVSLRGMAVNGGGMVESQETLFVPKSLLQPTGGAITREQLIEIAGFTNRAGVDIATMCMPGASREHLRYTTKLARPMLAYQFEHVAKNNWPIFVQTDATGMAAGRLYTKTSSAV